MKKLLSKSIAFFSFLSMVVLLSLLFCTEAKAAAYQTADADYEYEANGTGIRITRYTGVTLQQVKETTYAVIVPNKIDGKTVNAIGAYAFAEQKHISEFILPNTITGIANHAFYNCYNLNKLNLPSSLKTVGSYAFYNAPLQSVSVPKNVKSIGSFAFGTDGVNTSAKCKSVTVNASNKKFCAVNGVLYNKAKKELIYYPGANKSTSFTIPSTVTSMTTWAFNDARKLKKISMDKCKITSIPEAAFQLNALQTVALPKTLKKIGAYAFAKSGITSLDIPSKVSTLGEGAFNNCSALKTVVISSKSLEKLPADVFGFCKVLNSVTLSESIRTIGDGAFNNCISLKKITLPKNVVSIGDYAFRLCDSLKTVTIKGSVTHIGYTAFDGISRLTIIAKKGTYPESYAAQKNITFKKL